MKLRTGFVSNSSSCSFICECCGEVESGMDVSLEEIEYVRCECGHLLCEDHLDIDITNEKYIEELLADPLYVNCKGEKHKYDICEGFLRNRVHKKYCPICNGTYITDYRAMEYMLAKLNMTRKELDEEIRNNES